MTMPELIKPEALLERHNRYLTLLEERDPELIQQSERLLEVAEIVDPQQMFDACFPILDELHEIGEAIAYYPSQHCDETLLQPEQCTSRTEAWAVAAFDVENFGKEISAIQMNLFHSVEWMRTDDGDKSMIVRKYIDREKLSNTRDFFSSQAQRLVYVTLALRKIRRQLKTLVKK